MNEKSKCCIECRPLDAGHPDFCPCHSVKPEECKHENYVLDKGEHICSNCGKIAEVYSDDGTFAKKCVPHQPEEGWQNELEVFCNSTDSRGCIVRPEYKDKLLEIVERAIEEAKAEMAREIEREIEIKKILKKELGSGSQLVKGWNDVLGSISSLLQKYIPK